MKFTLVLCALALAAPAIAQAQNAIPVTADNFNRAETDMYFALFAKRGALGRFIHLRDLPLENTGVRPNRDTLYSEAVFDLDAGPVRITLPKAGNRFMSMMVVTIFTKSITLPAITTSPEVKWARVTFSWRSAF